MTHMMTGGCQCGRVRYSAVLNSFDAYYCHCRMCQRATGGIAAALVQVPRESIIWLSAPDWYQSSAIARRPFCSTCGTPLGFDYLGGGDGDLTVGSFDDPSRFVPVANFGTEAMIEAWADVSQLPRKRTDACPSTVERWRRAGHDVPD